MKTNRWVALAAIAILAMGAVGAVSYRAYAQGTPTPAPQSQDCSVDEADGTEAQSTTDTDTVDLQCGEQVEDGQPDGAFSGAQDPSYAGSVAVDQVQTEGMNEADEAAAMQGKATISATHAEAAALAANPGATVIQSELDNENGALVYSVELSNGADVKVDAGNGSILFTDSGADSEG
jgi:uncharacterized membrane protein YkoI